MMPDAGEVELLLATVVGGLERAADGFRLLGREVAADYVEVLADQSRSMLAELCREAPPEFGPQEEWRGTGD